MPIPYYLADPDQYANSPFDAPPAPSVEESQDTKVDPFADDPNDPRIKRIQDLDKQLSGRAGTLGGFLGALSPHGDKVQANLMAQRHMLGNEYHGDQQLKRQLASSRMLQESAFRRADALEKAAAERGQATIGAAGTRAGASMYGADQSLAGKVYGADRALEGVQARTERPFPVAAGASVYDPATGTNGPQNAFRPPAAGRQAAAGRAPVDPQVPVLQAEMKQIAKVLNDPNITDDQKAPLYRKYNIARQKLQQLGGQGAPAPSAAPPTAPSVQNSGRPTATGPNGEKVEWDGTNWVPVS